MSNDTVPPVAARRRYWLAIPPLALAAGLTWYAWRPTPTPPTIDLDGADPEVAEAVRWAERDLHGSSRSAEGWGRLGMVLRAHSYGAEANQCFEEAERLDPSEPRWPYYRGLTVVLTDPPAGLACLRRAEGRASGEPSPLFRLVEVLLEQGELGEAQQRLDQAGRQFPGHPRGILLRARLAAARGDWAEAARRCVPCLADPRTRRQAHLLASDAHRRLGDSARAQALGEQARKLPPDAPFPDPLTAQVGRLQVGLKVRLAQALDLERQGNDQAALALLDRLAREYPHDALPPLLLGQALRQRKLHAPAEQALTRAVAIAPDNIEAWFSLGTVRVFLGQAKPAAEAFREVLRQKPDHTLAYHNLGICLKSLGDLDGARGAWSDALRSQPDYKPSQEALRETAAPN